MTLAFDIEVYGLPWEEVDELTRGYLKDRAKTDKDREAVEERTALLPGLGRVIVIGLWSLAEDRGIVLVEGKPGATKEWDKVSGAKIFRGDERALLEEFWRLTGPGKSGRVPQLVSFNGRGYDGPMLMIRSAQLGVKPSRNLVGYRYSMAEHCDLQEVFTFQGTTRDWLSLEYWCRRFDVESPKGSIDGSQVARVYREGRIDDIAEYCLRDVRATAQLYRKVEETLLPHFAAGRGR